ncbi:MAG: hypothetical protein EZS28_001578 [Streblomastix strix]|uniref:Uncharacterized protein n=1 Tax=Streblomastix strix TaxID=222440 RepID=A0A5J4X816_9EUKA|nr:MAG: hypothetical protein EZS28_001578 [Streblomastix strix]
MAQTARRLAEISRATLDLESIKTDTININTEIMNVGSCPVIISLHQFNDERLCHVQWFKRWWHYQESRSDSGEIIWGNVIKGRTTTLDYCSRLIKQVLAAVGIYTKLRITQLRSASITKVMNLRAPQYAVNAWCIHLETAKSMQKYYYKSNNLLVSQMLLRTGQINSYFSTTSTQYNVARLYEPVEMITNNKIGQQLRDKTSKFNMRRMSKEIETSTLNLDISRVNNKEVANIAQQGLLFFLKEGIALQNLK